MKSSRLLMRGIIAACAMLVTILDAETAVISAREGVSLCIHTVIPSLFPFFVLSGVINSCLLGQNLRFLHPLGRLCKIPKGTESLLMLGFLAGYPIGAQLITQAYKDRRLTAETAKRMLGFCNNAGPAFLFGILSPLFTRRSTVWILWVVHILAAIITAIILPAANATGIRVSSSGGISLPESLHRALKAIASVCGWVILFRVVLAFCNRWFLWIFSKEVQVLISGFLELTNGCVLLQSVSSEGLRFLLAGTMLSFGGLCVGMQTISVTEELGSSWYFPGKIMETIFTILLCSLVQPILFDNFDAFVTPLPIFAGLVIFSALLIFILHRKKVVAFSSGLLYNIRN